MSHKTVLEKPGLDFVRDFATWHHAWHGAGAGIVSSGFISYSCRVQPYVNCYVPGHMRYHSNHHCMQDNELQREFTYGGLC